MVDKFNSRYGAWVLAIFKVLIFIAVLFDRRANRAGLLIWFRIFTYGRLFDLFIFAGIVGL